MASRVVIGYDGSEASEDAVAFGLTWCRSTGDVPIVATVYPEEHPLRGWARRRRMGDLRPGASRDHPGQGPGPLLATRRSTATSPSTSAAHGLADLAEDVEAVAADRGHGTGDQSCPVVAGQQHRAAAARRDGAGCSRAAAGGGSQRQIGSPASGWPT